MKASYQIGLILMVTLLLPSACKSPSPSLHEEDVVGASARAGEAAAVKPDPATELNELDPRRPVPLQPMMAWHQKQNMQDHLLVVQEIIGALAQEDWEGVARASSRIESSPTMAQMCQHMGAGAEGFVELALEFHGRADEIAAAARSQNTAAVLKTLSKTMSSCTQCHAIYRQDLVTAKEWETATGEAHEPLTHQ